MEDSNHTSWRNVLADQRTPLPRHREMHRYRTRDLPPTRGPTASRRTLSNGPPDVDRAEAGFAASRPGQATKMSSIAIVGAGKGLGAAVARRFGAEGFTVGLISRNQARLDGLAATLAGDGVEAKGFAADIRDPASVAHALEQVTETLGPIEVLQYSPLPQKDFMRPVLETMPQDLVGPIEFSIYGPVAAVHQVVPGMRFSATTVARSCSSTGARR